MKNVFYGIESKDEHLREEEGIDDDTSQPDAHNLRLGGELKTLIRQHLRENPKKSFADALSTVANRRPDLWQQYKEGR
jgi:hypothetical protein